MKKKEWEKKYKSKTIDKEPDAAALLRENTHLFSGGTALDIAMGMGQNAIFLASHGYKVTGIDRSSSAVSLSRENAEKKAVSLRTVEADILTYGIRENYFDVILNFYFLERSLIQKIKKGLKKNGLVFFETYTTDQSRFGGPKNPDFLLKPNELLNCFLDFFIIFYHERIEEKKAIVSLIAQKV
jgi:2-polyprenyl-3-methyl-5-hydroxy-6-metoxy-1,4-benzoquinol methylase